MPERNGTGGEMSTEKPSTEQRSMIELMVETLRKRRVRHTDTIKALAVVYGLKLRKRGRPRKTAG